MAMMPHMSVTMTSPRGAPALADVDANAHTRTTNTRPSPRCRSARFAAPPNHMSRPKASWTTRRRRIRFNSIFEALLMRTLPVSAGRTYVATGTLYDREGRRGSPLRAGRGPPRSAQGLRGAHLAIDALRVVASGAAAVHVRLDDERLAAVLER